MDHQHTPGPWRLDDAIHGHLIDDGYHFIDAGAGCYAEGDRDGFGIQGCLSSANARLIAAAPDLLDALQVLFDSYKQLADSGDSGFWKLEEQPEGQQALAAIAKATGTQP